MNFPFHYSGIDLTRKVEDCDPFIVGTHPALTLLKDWNHHPSLLIQSYCLGSPRSVAEASQPIQSFHIQSLQEVSSTELVPYQSFSCPGCNCHQSSTCYPSPIGLLLQLDGSLHHHGGAKHCPFGLNVPSFSGIRKFCRKWLLKFSSSATSYWCGSMQGNQENQRIIETNSTITSPNQHVKYKNNSDVNLRIPLFYIDVTLLLLIVSCKARLIVV